MFLIASSGRSGTNAICDGLNAFSDHEVAHEPDPLLLEAFLKHTGQDYQTAALARRMEFLRGRGGQAYGESFRAPNLLGEVAAAAPGAKFLILLRDPADYVISAHDRQVFRRGDVWDQTRLVPLSIPEEEFAALPLAEKIAWHWIAVNQYLLDFAGERRPDVKVAILADLQSQLPRMAEFLGVTITQPGKLQSFLSKKPNASGSKEPPPGYDRDRIHALCRPLWEQARDLAGF